MPRFRSSRRTSLRLLQAGVLVAIALVQVAGKTEEGGTLEVVVTGLKNDRGKVVMALIASKESYEKEDQALRSAEPEVKNRTVTVRFEDLPYGVYAVKVYHDENSNEKLDTNWTRIMPKESFGFSNNVMGKFGPPGFDEAKFEFSQSEQKLEIEIKHP